LDRRDSMSNDEIKSLLTEIRDNQAIALERQARQIEIAAEQLERGKRQIEESLSLQREAVAKQRAVMRLALPGIGLCIAAVLYLTIRYL
jgi:hypothetical protein